MEEKQKSKKKTPAKHSKTEQETPEKSPKVETPKVQALSNRRKNPASNRTGMKLFFTLLCYVLIKLIFV